ncbi:MAG: sodium:alanine symporter family protein [Selenomonadaceae bacterium]|nr:sodium:alanine symporter family protein [Selenomonadaceae bacterium]
MELFLVSIDSKLWGPPMIIFLLGTGIFFTIRLKFLQVTKLATALRMIGSTKDQGKGDISSFRALCLSLGATVGIGNIIGVTTAVKFGGPGSIFWMGLAAFFGMATRYAEGLLAIKFRAKDENGEVLGGPMAYIEYGMGKKFKPLAIFFAMTTLAVALFGVGIFPQVQAITDTLKLAFKIPPFISDPIVAIIVGMIILGGLQKISRIMEKIVPFMLIFFIALSVLLVIIHAPELPDAVELILMSAFTGDAIFGGFAGTTVMMAVSHGLSRGLFSNESGLGSMPIASAAARTRWGAEQGLLAMTVTFIDTILICTLMGLSLVLTGVWNKDLAVEFMAAAAFQEVYGTLGLKLFAISTVLFAFTTILGWNYYGERAMVYLFRTRGILLYRVTFIVLIAIAAFTKLEFGWIIADIANALMAIPNLIALIALSKNVVADTKIYMEYQLKFEEKNF